MEICKSLTTSTALMKPYPNEVIMIDGLGSFLSVDYKEDEVIFTKGCEAKELQYRNEVYMAFLLYRHAGKPITLLAVDGTVVIATHSSYNDWLETLWTNELEVSRLCAGCELLTVCQPAKEFLSVEPLTLKSIRDTMKLLTTMETLETAKIRTMLEQGEQVDGYTLSQKTGRNGNIITSVLIND